MALAERGLAAQQADDLDAAEVAYRASLELDPANADVLHMLGVVRMQKFAYDEARDMIFRAAELVDWEIASFRHNYGYLLSAYLSSRPSAHGVRHAQEVQSARSAIVRARTGARQRIAVVVLRGDGLWFMSFVAGLAGQSVRPDVLIVPQSLSPHVSGAAALLAETPFQVVATGVIEDRLALAAVIAQCEAEFVQLATDECEFRPERLRLMRQRLVDTGARWAFSRIDPVVEGGDVQHAPDILRSLDVLRRLTSDSSISALCAERPALPISVANLFFDRALLSECLQDPIVTSFHSALSLSFAALWRDEPVVSVDATLALRPQIIARINERLSDVGHAAVLRMHTERSLVDRPVNPMAPSVATYGSADYLKRSLRQGLGAYLQKTQFAMIWDGIARRKHDDMTDPSGIEYVGFARAESGLGENLRALVAATRTAGIPLSVTDVPIDSGIRNGDDAMLPYMTDVRCRTRVVCVNPDLLGEAYHNEGVGRFTDAYRIGFWFWELERLPRSWLRQFELVNEVWAATDFVVDAIRRDATCPVIKIRTPVQAPVLARHYTREEFGLDPHACVFLFSFAYGSYATRKNPEATIRAFLRAFPLGTEHVQLVIKTSQSELFPALREQLHVLAKDDARIIFMDRYLTRQEVFGLQSVANCFVSLHRAEGLGLGLAECMAQGKPVIATAYSGNLEFMNSENSFLVDFRLVPVLAGEYPDYSGQVWADASDEHAASIMRRIYDTPDDARAIGQRARQGIARDFSFQATGEQIKRRFAAIRSKQGF